MGALFTGLFGMNNLFNETSPGGKLLVEKLNQIFQQYSFLIFSPKDVMGLLVNLGLGFTFAGLVWVIYKFWWKHRRRKNSL
jgi:hypothetical protein